MQRPGSIALITPSVTVIRRLLVDALHRSHNASLEREGVAAAVPDDERQPLDLLGVLRLARLDGGDREHVVEHRHSNHEPGAYLVGDEGCVGVRDPGIDLDTSVHRPRMHHELPVRTRAGVMP